MNRKTVTISIDAQVLSRLQEIRRTKGIPIGRSLELAFLEVNKDAAV